MADGFGFGAEGDWKTAALVRLVKVMATGLPGGTSFMEDYTYDLDPAAPKVLGAHMLEVCPSIARSRPRCEIHPLSIGSRSDPVRLVFDADTGPAVVAGMTDLGERFRIVANVVDIVDAGHELPRLPVARAVWQPRPDLRTAVEAWLIAGGAHHTVLSRAVGPEPLADFAEMAGIEFVLIDEETRVSAVQKELRWNAAYYHLVRGL
jgi:L-arabinose isomerase